VSLWRYGVNYYQTKFNWNFLGLPGQNICFGIENAHNKVNLKDKIKEKIELTTKLALFTANYRIPLLLNETLAFSSWNQFRSQSTQKKLLHSQLPATDQNRSVRINMWIFGLSKKGVIA